MNNLNRNTLVRDFIGAVFCLMMAFALLMMYSGCSEDNSPINGAHGGAAEEQGVYALAGRAGDVYPKVMGLDGLDSVSGINDGRLEVPEGTVVAVYELNPLTLEPNGRVFLDTIDNGEGRFAFENIFLGSPYVLIEIRDSCIAFDCQERGVWGSSSYQTYVEVPCESVIDSSWGGIWPTDCGILDSTKYPVSLGAIVDVRNYQESGSSKISINTLSYLKIPLLKKYFAEGMSFAAAGKKAEQEILENFGIYEDLGEFENAENVNGELSYVLRMIVRIITLGDAFVYNFPIPFDRYYYITFAAANAFGSDMEQVYLNKIKMLDYGIGYYLQEIGVGRCTESRENEVYKILGHEYMSVVCRSGKWKPGRKKLEYSSGVMTDARDGKTYKTVTYNWGDITQTWMAENLNYTDATSSKTCWDGDSSCDYGRYYTWRTAMDLDWSSIKMTSRIHEFIWNDADSTYKDKWETVAVEDMCLKKGYLEGASDSVKYAYCYVKSPDGKCVANDTADNVYSYCYRKYDGCHLDLSESVFRTKPVAYRGVCPEGWRIPNKEDWEILGQNVAARGASFTDVYGSGFGYTAPMSDVRYALVPSENDVGRISFTAFVGSENVSIDMYMNFTDAPRNALPFFVLNNEMFVRCIKN
ncbi:FISUMP domain-containing protein [Fibrobacter succinogenes]|uniref:FISUMP domain-containing protein n=1 Tax=Fibrobacter succinogenes TaxID=833 RepID=UPI0015686C7E|nr:FISUMP domain-containing protein [Fibrobacter succinogenes]